MDGFNYVLCNSEFRNLLEQKCLESNDDFLRALVAILVRLGEMLAKSSSIAILNFLLFSAGNTISGIPFEFQSLYSVL